MDEIITTDELSRDHVHIADPKHVQNIIKQMVADGPSKLQVISDFDSTLSKHSQNGKICQTCHNVLEESHLLPDFYKNKAREVRDIYLPIEFDPLKTVEEKTPYMIEWWTKAHQLLVKCDISKNSIRDIVKDCEAYLRDGCKWMFDELHSQEIPLLIFSAGIGDVIEQVITQRATMHDNMKIVSNYMDFNNEGKLVGFKGELMHTFNKNENAIHSSDYFENLNRRTSLILLGDHVGDLRMAEGATGVKHSLKIGFLNKKIEENLELYKKNFDIVLVQDETMDVVNSILKKIISSH